MNTIKSGTKLTLEGHPPSTCVLTVENISVYVVRQDEGVSVYLYPLDGQGSAGGPCLGETWATFAEAEPDEDFVE